MEIDEQHVFRFRFPFLGTEAIFNVVAETRMEAAERIQQWMRDTLTELAISFPKIQAEPEVKEKPKAMEELRIATLIDDLGKYLAIADTTENTIKEWLKMDYEPNNFPLIIDGLEKLKSAYETGKIKKGNK